MSNRRGFGILLVFVAIILLIIFASGAGQSFFSSQVISHTHRAAIGNNCRYLAESVCEEAFFRIENEANNPSTETFTLFREKVFGRGPAPFEISLSSFPQSEAYVESLPKAHKYAVDEVIAQVLFRRQITGLSYEVSGSIQVSAVVSSGFYSGLKRRYEIVRDFKMALISSPRPFCKATIFFGSANSFLHTEPNKNIRICYSNIREACNYFEKTLEKAKDENQQEVVDELEPALNELKAAAGDFLVGPENIEEAPDPPADKPVPHFFGDAAGSGEPWISTPGELMIMTAASEQDLSAIDLLSIVEPLEEKAQDATDKYNDQVNDFKAFLDEESTDPDEYREELEKLKEVSLKYIDASVLVLSEYYKFQELLSEKTGSSFKVWENFVLRKLRLAEWRAKAFYKIKKFDDLTELVNASGGSLSGIVYIDTDSPVNISGFRHKGKLIVVVPDDLTLESVTVADSSLDILTFISYGDVSLDGQIDASVILGVRGEEPPALNCGGSLKLSGSLIAAEGATFSPGSLQGFVKKNENVNSGDTGVDEKLNHYFVAISPHIRCRSAGRR